MLSCFGFRPSRARRTRSQDEREPLLPQYNDDDTALQTRLHEKLHTYQMLRAISHGYMPSNAQTIVHLRSLLSADVLNPAAPELSDAGLSLVRSVRLWLQQLVELLQHKNAQDQIQDFVWYLQRARVEVDVSDVGARAAAAKAKADSQTTYRSLHTIGSLLLNNSEFRLFLSELATVGREVFRDTASTIADVSSQAAQQLDPPSEGHGTTGHQNGDQNGDAQSPPTKADLQHEVQDVSQVVVEGAADVANEAGHSLIEHIDEEHAGMLRRLKGTVLNLRKRPDYSESVSLLSMLLRKYLLVYSHVATDIIDAVEEDVVENQEADRALHNFVKLVTSFGDKEAWNQVKKSFDDLVEHGRTDANFDKLATQLANLVQSMLLDPAFFDDAEKHFRELRDKSRELLSRSDIANHAEIFFKNLQSALKSMGQDADIHKLSRTSRQIANILSPANQYINKLLVTDSINVFVPILIQLIQYLPIPRLEVSTPAIDLLLENLILEPGRTVNNTSFLPYRMHVSTRNDVDIRKARFRTVSSLASVTTVTIAGLSIAADDMGYWLRLHSGLLRLADEGLAGFHLDERGIDITLELEIGQERLEHMVALRSVNVHIHRLTYTLSKSRFACIAWLLKPLIRPIVRKALEIKIATAISQGLHTLNRELVFARERLRATRIANPDDVWTFVKAVAARLKPPEDPDVEARIGVQPGAGVFRGRYAPGSLVQLWQDEGRLATQRAYEYDRGGWRNEIFDVTTRVV